MLMISGKLDALIAGYLAGLLGAILEICGLFLICLGCRLYSRPANAILDASAAASSSTDAFFAFLFRIGFILLGLVALAYAWYALRCARNCT